MSNRKFFVIVLLLLALVFMCSGCGGGGGGAGSPKNSSQDVPPNYVTVYFDSNGGSNVEPLTVLSGSTIEQPTNPTRDGYIFVGWYKDEDLTEAFAFGEDGDIVETTMTLYAGWIQGDEDALIAEYVVGEIEIIYAVGDNALSVTQDITLPSSVEDFPVTWVSSNPDAISSTGKVNRPQGNNLNVTLTASASSGNVTRTRNFTVTVIKRHEQQNIGNFSVTNIQNMNAGNKKAHISYNADQTQVTTVQGKFSDITVQNVDDARDAVQSVRSVLGLSNAADELATTSVSNPETGPKYRFSQVYNGKQVFGRGVTVSTNDSGDTNFLQSSLLSTELLENTALTESITRSQAEESARANYSISVVVSADSEPGIYSFGEYESNPVLVYSVQVIGDEVDDTVYVNASNGDIVEVFPNADDVIGWGQTEDGGNERVSFDIDFSLVDARLRMFPYRMYDKELHVQMFASLFGLETQINNPFNVWRDTHEVSAYYNVRKVQKWLKETFDRDGITGNGSTVKVVTHARIANAAWNYNVRRLYVSNTKFPYYSCAAALDVLAHEAGHGVMDYIVNNPRTYGRINKAIKEGYADIFGCLIEKNWVIGENVPDISRNIAENQISSRAERAYVDSLKISRSAYFMHQDNGGSLTWDELARLWYNSLSMGIDGKTDFNDIRTFVTWTAENMELSNDKLYSVVQAFNKAGINGRSVINGTVLYSSDVPVSGATVTYREETATSSLRTTTDAQGKFTISGLDWGYYVVTVSADGYKNFQITQFVDESDDVALNVAMIVDQTGSLSGTIYNGQTGALLSGVYLELREGWNNNEGSVIANMTTSSDGTYTFPNLGGYYTVNMSKENFIASSFNVSVAGNTTNQFGYLSPVMSDDANYRVVLSWGAIPPDIDSHLIAPSSYGGTIEIYFSNKTGTDAYGNEIVLDVDDTDSYGPETVTFTADPSGTYEYFVHWYRGEGNWSQSNAVVTLYSGGSSTPIRTWNVPASTTSYNNWRVFTIQNGIIRDINTISSNSY